MAIKIYVGNLPFGTHEAEIRQLFGRYGVVRAIQLSTDLKSGLPCGFGFVEMEPREANTAIRDLNGARFGERRIKVRAARER